jgi:hypothetical protein
MNVGTETYQWPKWARIGVEVRADTGQEDVGPII